MHALRDHRVFVKHALRNRRPSFLPSYTLPAALSPLLLLLLVLLQATAPPLAEAAGLCAAAVATGPRTLGALAAACPEQLSTSLALLAAAAAGPLGDHAGWLLGCAPGERSCPRTVFLPVDSVSMALNWAAQLGLPRYGERIRERCVVPHTPYLVGRGMGEKDLGLCAPPHTYKHMHMQTHAHIHIRTHVCH